VSVGVYFKKLRPDAQLPKYAHPDDSGADVCTTEEITIPPGELRMIPTGIAVQLPPGYEIQVRSKGGIASKKQCFVLNSPGTVDEGYRGEIMVIMQNVGKDEETFNKGDKVAQLVVAPYIQATFLEQAELTDTMRGAGGFGSTGK